MTIIRSSVAVSFLLALVMGLFASSAFASRQAVLADYADNGKLEQCYAPGDYAAALKAVRPDQQQYGAAVDVIQQAQIQCVGTTRVSATAASGAKASNEVTGRVVLADYEDNGQINGCYTLAQFEDALRQIRPDQQQYGAAVDVIRQAELTNLRRPGEACGAASDGASSAAVSEDSGLPGAVIVIIVLAVLALIAAGAWFIISRRRGGDGPPTGRQ